MSNCLTSKGQGAPQQDGMPRHDHLCRWTNGLGILNYLHPEGKWWATSVLGSPWPQWGHPPWSSQDAHCGWSCSWVCTLSVLHLVNHPLTRTQACLQLSTVPSEDTISCDFPLAWSVPKTSSRKRWIWSSKSAKDVSELQTTSLYMATPRENMMPAYEILCVLPANMTWCSIHRKHMWRPKPSISLAASIMPMESTQTQARSMLYMPCQHPPISLNFKSS